MLRGVVYDAVGVEWRGCVGVCVLRGVACDDDVGVCWGRGL